MSGQLVVARQQEIERDKVMPALRLPLVPKLTYS